ncbi:MAG: anthranilate synthase component I, partial [Desulfobacteraceae bacterium]|nr:anthranilate synthase component I [Desulfobacteraceae bacterium]
MIQPELTDFRRLAARAGLVPVCREIVADLDTPLTAFAKVALDQRHAFLLESLEGGEKWGRYSFIGLNPLATFTSRGEEIEVRRGERIERATGDPVAALKELLRSFTPRDPGYPSRFFGGAVGFLGYDLVRFMERLPALKPERAGFPDSSLMVPKLVLVCDSIRQTIAVVNWVPTGGHDAPERLYQEAVAEIEAVIGRLRGPLPPEVSRPAAGTTHEFSANMSREEFMAMVERAKEYILAGDIIQVVLSQRFHSKT